MEIAFKIDCLADFEMIDRLLEGKMWDGLNPVDQEIFSRCLRLVDILQIKKCDRILLGSEFCQFLIPNSKKIKKIISKCTSCGIAFTLLTPHVDPDGMEAIKNLFEQLRDEPIEVEINDVGILSYVTQNGFHNWKLAFGRMLDQSFHDGRLSSSEMGQYYRTEDTAYLQELPFQSEGYRSLLRKNRIQMCDIDFPNVPMKNAKGYGVFLPYTYMTTGSMCKMRCLGQSIDDKFSLDDNVCAMKCRTYVERMDKRWVDLSQGNTDYVHKGYTLQRRCLYRKGNTIFYLNPLLETEAATLAKTLSAYDRLVFQIKLML